MRLGGQVRTTAALVLPGQTAAGRLGRLRPVVDQTTPVRPTPHIEDDQLIRLMYTSGTESHPKGAMHSSRSLMGNYISSIIAGVDGGQRRRDPLAAAVSLRAAGQLPDHRCIPRRDQHHPAEPGSRAGAAHDRSNTA